MYDEFFVPALFAQWVPRLLDLAAVGAGSRVLDVGCGTGIVARAASERVGPSGLAVGIDPNDAMLAVARRAPEQVEWRHGTAEAVGYENGAFDRVVAAFSMMFFGDRDGAVREMARVLGPDGRVVIATWSSVEESPGYAAMVSLVRGLFGDEPADALLAPFCLGEETELVELVGRAFDEVEVIRSEGVARFPSVDAWVHTDIRGWTLADMIDDDDFERLRAAASDVLTEFTDAEGRVSFAAPALLTTGRVGTRARPQSD